VGCILAQDYFCLSMIALGMLASGVSCLVIGSGTIKFDSHSPAKGSPDGSGILNAGSDIVILIGSEGPVGAVTRGAFSLQLAGEPRYHAIGLVAGLLVVQFIVQLLLVPQGTLFGQVMFLTTFGVSWIYNCYLSSIDKAEIHRYILTTKVLGLGREGLRKYVLGTRTTAVVFILLVLRPENPRVLLEELLPNDTETWRTWKENVFRGFQGFHLDMEKAPPFFTETGRPSSGNDLLESLYSDSLAAYKGYQEYQNHQLSQVTPGSAKAV